MSNRFRRPVRSNPNTVSRRIALREWLILSASLILFSLALIYLQLLKPLDLPLYDLAVKFQSKPARDDIVIVAIDDYSLAELGKWPWPRAYHADLVQQLKRAQARAVGIDIIFAEPEFQHEQTPTNGDQKLALAMQEAGNVVIPLASVEAGKGLQAAIPLASLSQAATGLGHNHIELDSDGVARSVYLKEGTQGQWWPHFMLRLHDVGERLHRDIHQQKEFPGTRALAQTAEQHSDGKTGLWQRDFHMLIPFYGGTGQFRSIPYVAVLRGEVPADVFRDKYVLIGATAQGMADAFPTPVTSQDGILSGVEINANILASLLDQRSIIPASPWQVLSLSFITLILTLAGFLFLSPRIALIAVMFNILLSLGLSVVLLRYGFWFSPTASVLVLSLAYPLWSWRRLEAAIDFLGEEFDILDKEPHLLPEFDPNGSLILAGGEQPYSSYSPRLRDKLEKHINAMRLATRRVRDLRQFVTDSLYGLPDAALITTRDGTVVMCNPTAESYFKSLGVPNVIDTLVPYLFANMSPPQTEYASQRVGFSWWHILDLDQTALLSKGVEVIDPQSRNLIIKSAPCYSSKKELVAWIISMIDISEIRQAEKRRDETLHFISHDMRAPQASILALIELQKDPKTAIDHQSFLDRIESASQATLGLADNFVQLAHAESQDYRLVDLDFQDLLIEASEEMWALARSKQIRINTVIPEGEYPVKVDRSLMRRVLCNLLSNAIKYSPSQTTVTCTLGIQTQQLSDQIVCTIQDQGYGIPRELQSRLFQRFDRLGAQRTEGQASQGIGLGMVFVKTVMDRHFAQIRFHSVVGEGTLFSLHIPAGLIR